ncbi:hypothetical protein QJQ45_029873 [Haematococcus lacustris]|nr:hypothetical protein QJQ45_029873 [Haematococcus lacustris]
MERYDCAKLLVVFFCTAGIGTRGGWVFIGTVATTLDRDGCDVYFRQSGSAGPRCADHSPAGSCSRVSVAIPFIMQVVIMLTLTLIMHPAMQSTAFTPGAIPFWPLTNKSASLLIVGTVEVSSVQWCSALCGCEFSVSACLPTAEPLHGQQMPGDRSLESILDVRDTASQQTSCSALRPFGADLGLAAGDDGAPFSGQKVYAYAFTGTCERGVVDLFRHNATLGDARGNLLWWRNGVTSSNGTLWGTAPNILLPRRPGTQPNGAASILIVPPPQYSECSLWSGTTGDSINSSRVAKQQQQRTCSELDPTLHRTYAEQITPTPLSAMSAQLMMEWSRQQWFLPWSAAVVVCGWVCNEQVVPSAPTLSGRLRLMSG